MALLLYLELPVSSVDVIFARHRASIAIITGRIVGCLHMNSLERQGERMGPVQASNSINSSHTMFLCRSVSDPASGCGK